MIANKQSLTRGLAKIFVDRKGTVLSIMADYVNLPENITNGEATELYVQLLGDNPEFAYRIAELAIRDEFSSINGNSGKYSNLFEGLGAAGGGSGSQGGSGDEGGQGGGSSSGVTVGADPVSAIAGAIGSIFGFASDLVNRKTGKEQARYDLMNNILALEGQRQRTDPTQKTLMMVFLAGLGLVAVMLLTGGKKSGGN